MNQDVWRPRLVAMIAQAYRQCWGDAPPAKRPGERTLDWVPAEGMLADSDARLVAKADLILPFATAGLLSEGEKVAGLPAPAEIRRDVRESELHVRSMSIGCHLAGAERDDDSPFSDEVAREWSTWITYSMQAHSPELRKTLFDLPRAVEAITAYGARPRRRIERLGPDGERLVSLVPSGPDEDKGDGWIELFLDHCETVAAYADSLRSIEHVFPELLRLAGRHQIHSADEFGADVPFHPYLWPFTVESFRHVVEIAQGIRYVARNLNDDDDGQAMQMEEPSYVRV